jgi:aldehyde dehydrogenase (NAD+)
MGSKNPLVVLDDADLEVAVSCAINGAFYQTGQRCTASSRLIVTEKIHDRFVDAMVEAMKKLKVDHALEPGTQVGPVVDQKQLDQDLSYLEIGRQEGGRLAFGGERLERETEGYYLQPALITDTTNQMRINREEVFGPVASVIRVRDYDDALAVANDSPFGLSWGICTTSLKACEPLQAQRRGGSRDGQPADRGRRLPRPVRRRQRLELRPARAGPLRDRVLHPGQDRVLC